MGKNVMLPRDGTRKAALKHVCDVVLNADAGEETYLALLQEVNNDEDRLTIYRLNELETDDV
jgi:precorrin-3B methylase